IQIFWKENLKLSMLLHEMYCLHDEMAHVNFKTFKYNKASKIEKSVKQVTINYLLWLIMVVDLATNYSTLHDYCCFENFFFINLACLCSSPGILIVLYAYWLIAEVLNMAMAMDYNNCMLEGYQGM
ncbi:hypothetical protein ACJX0J_032588, partial [Zea mays]